MKKLAIILLFYCLYQQGACQEKSLSSQQLTNKEVEEIFLTQNLSLLAERYKIQHAEALKLQASYWPNPEFAVEEINLFSNKTAEKLPSLIGSYGQRQQISIAVEQLIETAGKRKKRIELQDLLLQSAEIDFAELLRNLKYELRIMLLELQQTQAEESLVKEQVQLLEELLKSYEKQAAAGNIAEVDVLRIKTENQHIKFELQEISNRKILRYTALKNLINLPANQDITLNNLLVIDQYIPINRPDAYIHEALLQRSDLQLANQEIAIAKQQETIARAEAKPDLRLGVAYDRGGNIMRDFIGLSLRSELPIFNRNKGAIKAATLAVQHKELLKEKLQQQLSNEITATISRLALQQAHLESWDPALQLRMQQTLHSYSKNLQANNLSLLAFLDFMQAYSTHQRTLLTAQEEYLKTVEELQFTIGKDIL
ncbi:TolC family protein [Sphingobacteriaceae bacterium WQ 2009]|uniref:TolC family protein n=1 Tax=Rhinopithecimicrobium faecis TaxID=2820698 RepID=A0A8T4H9C4_9SPHI|nr:TolC family protein [Sphingobacteriaceae bacterium WQ 2009]